MRQSLLVKGGDGGQLQVTRVAGWLWVAMAATTENRTGRVEEGKVREEGRREWGQWENIVAIGLTGGPRVFL